MTEARTFANPSVWTGTFTSVGYVDDPNGVISLLLPEEMDIFEKEKQVHLTGVISYTSSYKTNARRVIHVISENTDLSSLSFTGFMGEQPLALVLNLKDGKTIAGEYKMDLPENDSGTVLLTKTESKSIDLSEPQPSCSVM